MLLLLLRFFVCCGAMLIYYGDEKPPVTLSREYFSISYFKVKPRKPKEKQLIAS